MMRKGVALLNRSAFTRTRGAARLALNVGVVLVPLILAGGSAVSQGIGIRVLNDTNKNLKVTVYDLNAPKDATPMLSQVINSFASVSVNTQIGEDGYAHVRWVATSIPPDPHRCSHGDRNDVSEGATLHVYARDACEGAAPGP
jgi:hypothetical protein